MLTSTNEMNRLVWIGWGAFGTRLVSETLAGEIVHEPENRLETAKSELERRP